jgi:hypothetical protein
MQLAEKLDWKGLILMLFHGNSDYMNVPKCYVVCTLTVSFSSKRASPAETNPASYSTGHPG